MSVIANFYQSWCQYTGTLCVQSACHSCKNINIVLFTSHTCTVVTLYLSFFYIRVLLLLMVTCMVYTTNCVAYYVVPDDHYLDTDYGNNTLQHYLNNSEKYFTSHTQLLFLPGKHHLHTDLVIQGVQNLTLQGKGGPKNFGNWFPNYLYNLYSTNKIGELASVKH